MDRTEVNASPVQKALQGIKKYKYVLLTALLGVLLLLLPQNEKAADSGSATPSAAENFDREALQNEMEDILSSLDGVGKLSLMLTVEGGGAYELDQDETASLKARGEEVDEQTQKTETVVLGSGTSAEVVVTHSRYPRFVGALIVCEGGDRADVQLKVTQAMTRADITLEEDALAVQDVVVIGYGTQKKESMVASITSVKPSDLNITSSSLTTAFAGNIAGMISRQTSGEPGYDSASFYIRGISTFGSSNSPLIILDGVEVLSNMLNNMPPESIESFSVLKDAQATSVYGSRGANGVILINTKNGRNSEKMNVSKTPSRCPRWYSRWPTA